MALTDQFHQSTSSSQNTILFEELDSNVSRFHETSALMFYQFWWAISLRCRMKSTFCRCPHEKHRLDILLRSNMVSWDIYLASPILKKISIEAFEYASSEDIDRNTAWGHKQRRSLSFERETFQSKGFAVQERLSSVWSTLSSDKCITHFELLRSRVVPILDASVALTRYEKKVLSTGESFQLPSITK